MVTTITEIGDRKLSPLPQAGDFCYKLGIVSHLEPRLVEVTVSVKRFHAGN